LGKPLIPLEELKADDIVIIPAFGTTLSTEEKLKNIGLQTEQYNTTCPFVEKVWNRAEQIAAWGYSIIVHGKPRHEETRATFSHAAQHTPTVIVNDMEEAERLALYIRAEKDSKEFFTEFNGRYSDDFNPEIHLERIGVVNQTTQLASDTQAIADYLKQVMISHYGLSPENIGERFADTRDTLCYATNDNQTAVSGLLETQADLAIVVGGYNSSNTTHLAELCLMRLPTYFINGDEKIISEKVIKHYDILNHEEKLSNSFLPKKRPVDILLTSGASCPDALVEAVINRLTGYFEIKKSMEELVEEFLV
jgi:4-hydroxy-3-methylbut-2-enyl diphosphate reductase